MSAPSALRALEGKVHGRLGLAARSLRFLHPGLAPGPFGLLGWVAAAGGGSLTPVVRGGKGWEKRNREALLRQECGRGARIRFVARGRLFNPSGLCFFLGKIRTLKTKLA